MHNAAVIISVVGNFSDGLRFDRQERETVLNDKSSWNKHIKKPILNNNCIDLSPSYYRLLVCVYKLL